MSGSNKYFAFSKKKILWDIAGAFGDIGVLFPIALALIIKNGFNPTALFFMAGLFYVVSAYYFKITMPVQPLKAMSAIAIVTGLSYEVINAAGVVMGAFLILISVTGLSVYLGRMFPVSVVRGIQLGLGLMLIKTSLDLVNGELLIVCITASILILSFFAVKKLPPLIPILIIGVMIVLEKIGEIHIGPLPITPKLPEAVNLWLGFTVLVLPQVALTFGNAIVATEATGKILYGNNAKRLNFKSIPMSMGIANIISGVIGGAPMCHGSGGLTAHNKFGATSERSGYVIGFALIGLALMLGDSVLSLLSAFPHGILGVLLCYVGIQHSLFIRDILKDRSATLVALTTAIIGFSTRNLTIGFLAGIGLHYTLVGFSKTFRYFQKS